MVCGKMFLLNSHGSEEASLFPSFVKITLSLRIRFIIVIENVRMCRKICRISEVNSTKLPSNTRSPLNRGRGREDSSDRSFRSWLNPTRVACRDLRPWRFYLIVFRIQVIQ